MLYAIIAGLAMTALPNQTYAGKIVSGIKTNNTEVAESVIADKLLMRLNEINNMDKTDMKRAEKRELRKEVLAIDAELRSMSSPSPSGGGSGGGVYISVGAIIIIVLLLIILL